jgi:tetratricopeptide (TPR) repeat protein
MGVVYEAYDRERGMMVALKTLNAPDAEQLLRLKREFRAAGDIAHPHIVTLYELFVGADHCFFTMELIDGCDLASHLRSAGDQLASAAGLGRQPVPSLTATTASGPLFDRPGEHTSSAPGLVTATARTAPANSAGPALPETPPPPAMRAAPVPEERLRPALLALAGALDALHRAGVVHRDVKPANVMVSHTGRLLLMDFGIVADAAATRPDAIAGTPAYMSPEQARGELVTPASDWYSFGALLYEFLTGERLHRGSPALILQQKRAPQPPPALLVWPDGVPEDLRALCGALLEEAPERRPDGQQVLHCLRRNAWTGDEPRAAAAEEQFIGRRAELELLASTAATARIGGALLTLQGRSGVGKTALIREFLGRLGRNHPAAWLLRGRCHEREILAHKGFDALVDQLIERLQRLPAPVRRELLRGEAALAAGLFPALRTLPELADPGEPLSGDLLARRSRMIGGLRLLLTRVAAERLLVLWIDDVQWIDHDSIQVLQGILGEEIAGLLVILSRRSDPAEIDASLQDAIQSLPATRRTGLELQPLGRSEELALVEALHDGPLPADSLDEILQQSRGIPLFTAELVRYTVRSRQRGQPVLRPSFAEALLDRVTELPAAARALLESAAVAGEPTPAEALAEVAGLGADERERVLSLLRSATLVRTVQRQGRRCVDAYHDMIRETITAGLDPTRLRHLHHALAGALEASQGAASDRLARHYLAAGATERAVGHFLRAAESARQSYAFDSAAEHLRVALAHGTCTGAQRLAQQRALADCLALAGRAIEAAQAYGEAAAGCPPEQRELIHQLRHCAAEQLLRGGEISAGTTAIRAVLAERGLRVPATGMRTIPALLYNRLRLHLRGLRWQPQDASQVPAASLQRFDQLYSIGFCLAFVDQIRGAYLFDRVLRDALDWGEPTRVALGLVGWVISRGSEGRQDAPEVVAVMEEIATIAAAHDHPYLRGLNQLMLGYRGLFRGELGPTLDDLAAAETTFARDCIGAEFERVNALWVRIMGLLVTGRLRDLHALVTDRMQDATLHGNAYARSVLLSDGNVWRLLMQDDPASAAATVDDLLAGWPTDSYTLAHYRHATAHAWLALYEGRFVDALTTARIAHRRMQRSLVTRVRVVAAFITCLAILAAAGAGDLGALRRAGRRLRRLGIPASAGMNDFATGVLALHRGDPDAALASLARAEERLRAHGFLIPVAEAIRHRRGQLLGGSAGALLCDQAVAAMLQQGVRRPERLLTALAPPLPE